MSASPALQEAAKALCGLIQNHWSRFATYQPPEGNRPALYCPYAAIALVTGGPVPVPTEPAPSGYDNRPWQLAPIEPIIEHCRTHPLARELAARFYANARRADCPLFFDMARPKQELIGVWNASQKTNILPLQIAERIANRLI